CMLGPAASAQIKLPAVPPSFRNPVAGIHYERSREYNIKHILLRLKVDWPNRSAAGTVVHTIAPLRDGLTRIVLDSGSALKISACSVGGKTAKFTIVGSRLLVDCPESLKRGIETPLSIDYSLTPPRDPLRFIMQKGWHFIEPNKFEPERKP